MVVRFPLFLNAFFVSVSLLPSVGFADPIATFSSRWAFDATVRTTTLERFGPTGCIGLGPVLSASKPPRCFGLQPGVTYMTDPLRTYAHWGLNIDNATFSDGGFLSSYSRDVEPPPLTAIFDRPVSAFGFDTYGYTGMGFSIQVFDTTGALLGSLFEGLSWSQPVTAPQFFGFQSATANIGSFVLDGVSPHFGFAIDNFAFGGNVPNVPTPEPATLLLAATGLLACVRRRRSMSKRA